MENNKIDEAENIINDGKVSGRVNSFEDFVSEQYEEEFEEEEESNEYGYGSRNTDDGSTDLVEPPGAMSEPADTDSIGDEEDNMEEGANWETEPIDYKEGDSVFFKPGMHEELVDMFHDKKGMGGVDPNRIKHDTKFRVNDFFGNNAQVVDDENPNDTTGFLSLNSHRFSKQSIKLEESELDNAIEKELNGNQKKIDVDFPSIDLRIIKNTKDKSKLEGSSLDVYKKLLNKYKLTESLAGGYGNQPFFFAKNGDSNNYFFKLEGAKARGFVVSIGKFSKFAQPSEAKSDYGVISVSELSGDQLDQAVVDGGTFEPNKNEIHLVETELTKLLEHVALCVGDYLQKNPKVSKMYEEMQSTIKIANYDNNMSMSLSNWPGGLEAWVLQTMEKGKLNLITKK